MINNHNLVETLARIEHKLDLLLEERAMTSPTMSLEPVGSENHICPLCQTNVTYLVDIVNEGFTRHCNCSMGKQSAANLAQFAPPNTGNGNNE